MERSELFTVAIAALLIFLTVLLYILVTESNSTVTEGWSITTNDTAQNLRDVYVGDDGSVYMIQGEELCAIGRDGREKWKAAVPAIPGSTNRPTLRSVAQKDGHLYAYFQSDNWTMSGARGELVAISPEGRTLWQQPLEESRFADLVLAGDTLYLVHDTQLSRLSSITAFDRADNVSWTMPNVFGQPAFDDAGTAYLIYGEKIPIYSDLIQAYAPNGTQLWSRSLSEQGVHAPALLKYHNGSLFLTTYYGLAMLNTSGTVQWNKTYYSSWSSVSFDFDSAGNIYLISLPNVEALSPGGDVIADYNVDIPSYYNYAGIDKGVIYTRATDALLPNGSLENLAGVTLSAYNLRDNKKIWSYRIEPENVRTATVEPDNYRSIIEDSWAIDDSNSLSPGELHQYYNLAPGTTVIRNNTDVTLYPGQNRLYVSYWADNYEFPAQYGKAKCAYAGGLYAFDGEGRLLWKKPLDSYIDYLVEKNGTIYYSTGDGKFSAAATGVTAGLLAASFYVLLRFLLVGAVARARTRIDKNENRTGILHYISGSPGSTLYDISRGLAMNVGTVRYHLLVLTINHRVKVDRAETGFSRYYTNGGSFTAEERQVISFLKRGQIERLLRTMLEKPGLPNVEIAREIGLPESAVSRYLRELAGSGLVVKGRAESGKSSYFVAEKYRQIILGRLQKGTVSGYEKVPVSDSTLSTDY